MHEPQIVEYRNMRVLTTQQLAQSYDTSTDTITKNFNRNKDRYALEEHYFALEGEEKTRFLDQGQFDRGLKNAKTLYLWTQKGTLLHAKSLNTDVAWEVYGRLVDNYFSKATALDVSQLSPELQMFNQLFTTVARQELETKRIAAEQEQIKEVIEMQGRTIQAVTDTFVSSSDENFRDWANKCIAKIAESPKFDKGIGTNSNYAFARNESYERLKKKWKCNLEDRVSRAKGRALQRNPGISKTELDSINRLTIILADKSLRPVYETVIKEMMIAYCVDTDTKSR